MRCVHPLTRWDWSNGGSPRPAGLGVMEHVIKIDPLSVAVNEDWLRSQGQWHWVLTLLHGLTLWEPGMFGCSPLYTNIFHRPYLTACCTCKETSSKISGKVFMVVFLSHLSYEVKWSLKSNWSCLAIFFLSFLYKLQPNLSLSPCPVTNYRANSFAPLSRAVVT